jgi:hypothetical protein
MSTTVDSPAPQPVVSTETGEVAGGRTVTRSHVVIPINIARHANNIAMTCPRTRDRGGLNIWGNSLPAGTLPAGGVTVGGIPFTPLAADGVNADNVRCAAQYVMLPEVPVEWIHLIATSERRCEESVHLHYRSGAVDPEWLRVSDFWPARAHFGELLAARAAMHYPHHRQDNLSGQIWALRVPVPRREPLAGLRLPDNPAVHVFAISVESVR